MALADPDENRGSFKPGGDGRYATPQSNLSACHLGGEIVSIRSVQPEDIPRILAINEEGYPGVSPLTQAEVAEMLANSPYFCVAEVEVQVAGYLIAYTANHAYDGEEFTWFQQRYPDFLYIDQVAITATLRRARLGAYLYQQAEEFARAHGLTSLVCEVNLEPPNPVSLSFHAKQQFTEVGVLATQDGRTVSLRRKLLNGQEIC